MCLDMVIWGASEDKRSYATRLQRVPHHIASKGAFESLDDPRVCGHLTITVEPQLGMEQETHIVSSEVLEEWSTWAEGMLPHFAKDSATFEVPICFVCRQCE